MCICVEVSKKCTANGCDENPVESLQVKIEKLKKANVEVVYLSTCTRVRFSHYEELAKHFDVIVYTQGSEEGKKNNNINYIERKYRLNFKI